MVGELRRSGVDGMVGPTRTEAGRGAVSWRAFTRHFFEMGFSMMVGCVITCGIVLGALGADLSIFLVGLGFAVLVTVAMTVTMALWMRYRMHHSSRSTMEMSAAMFVPLAVFIGPYGLGWLPGLALCTTICVAMLPVMLGVMLYRRHEYGMAHNAGHSMVGHDAAEHDSEHCH